MIKHKAILIYILTIATMLMSCGGNGKIVSSEALIAFEDSTYDFGNVKQSDDSISHAFIFRNKGAKPLVIQNVETSCHCTVAEYPKEPIKPGGKGKLKVTFDAKDSLPVIFNKTITIYSNSRDGSTELTIKGNVHPD